MMLGGGQARGGRKGTLLVATTNPGKLREIAGILAHLPVELLTLRECDPVPEPEETGSTFAENARLKARYYSEASGLVTVADDSGLEIAALDNAPGVHSARWHGTDYATKFRKIQELFRERGVTGSAARFVCSIAVAQGDRIVFEAEGTIDGEIVAEPRGEHGFGYDPIFFYPPFKRTLAEIPTDQKSTVSHRGKAFGQLAAFIQTGIQ